MWKTKTFKTHEAQKEWVAKNERKCQIVIIFVENGYAVEYRPLRKIG